MPGTAVRASQTEACGPNSPRTCSANAVSSRSVERLVAQLVVHALGVASVTTS